MEERDEYAGVGGCYVVVDGKRIPAPAEQEVITPTKKSSTSTPATKSKEDKE